LDQVRTSDRRRGDKDDSSEASEDEYSYSKANYGSNMQGPSAIPVTYEDQKHGKLGFEKQNTNEQRTIMRLHKRIKSRHQASHKDREYHQESMKQVKAQEQTELNAIRRAHDEYNGLQGDYALKRDYMSLNDSHRDHARKTKELYSRYRDEKEEAAAEDYLVKRSGPGDRSLYTLEQEDPVESSLARHGMMLITEQETDKSPMLGLAYHAHDQLMSSPSNVPGPRLDASNLGSPMATQQQGQGGRPGSREARLGQNRPGSAQMSPRRNMLPQGPGRSLRIAQAAPGTFPDVEEERSPAKNAQQGVQVEVEPKQRYPMWTS
jgi:hypothetical protein